MEGPQNKIFNPKTGRHIQNTKTNRDRISKQIEIPNRTERFKQLKPRPPKSASVKSTEKKGSKSRVRFGEYKSPKFVQKYLIASHKPLKSLDKMALDDVSERCLYESLLFKHRAKMQVDTKNYRNTKQSVHLACEKDNCNFHLNVYSLSEEPYLLSKKDFALFSRLAVETGNLGFSPKVHEKNTCSTFKNKGRVNFDTLAWILTDKYSSESIGEMIPYKEEDMSNIFNLMYGLAVNGYFVINMTLSDIGFSDKKHILLTNFMKTKKIDKGDKKKVEAAVYQMLESLLPTLTFRMSQFDEFYFDDLGEDKQLDEVQKVYKTFSTMFSEIFGLEDVKIQLNPRFSLTELTTPTFPPKWVYIYKNPSQKHLHQIF